MVLIRLALGSDQVFLVRSLGGDRGCHIIGRQCRNELNGAGDRCEHVAGEFCFGGIFGRLGHRGSPAVIKEWVD